MGQTNRGRQGRGPVLQSDHQKFTKKCLHMYVGLPGLLWTSFELKTDYLGGIYLSPFLPYHIQRVPLFGSPSIVCIPTGLPGTDLTKCPFRSGSFVASHTVKVITPSLGGHSRSFSRLIWKGCAKHRENLLRATSITAMSMAPPWGAQRREPPEAKISN